MIDWDRLVVESEHNGVIASAGEVALLVGADAAGVTWGNITGDVTQQADLMALVDGYAPVDSPQFTGTPRTVTPPAGNNSTRIASTAFVKGAIDALGDLATQDTVNYETQVTNKPNFGALAYKSSITEDDIRHTEYLFVDGENGSDISGTGSLDNPFRSISKAIEKTSEIYLTIIQIYPGNYSESVYINNKKVVLYSLGDSSSEEVIIGGISIQTGFLELYGFLDIWGVYASAGAKVYYDPDINDSGYALSLHGRVSAGSGAEITIPAINLESGLSGSLLNASDGGIVTVNYISRADPHGVHVDQVAKADGGLVRFVDFGSNISFTTFKIESNNGSVVQLKNLDLPIPQYTGTKNYIRSITKDQFGGFNPSWTEAGKLAFENEPPASQHSEADAELYVRASYKHGVSPDHEYKYKWVKIGTISDLQNAGFTVS